MRILKVKNYDEMSKKAAAVIAAQIVAKPDSVLGLATGSTPIGTYQYLVKKYQERELDFSGIKTANLDEYKGLTKENDQSYYYFMNTNLFQHVNVDMNNTNIPNGMAEDANAECSRYEEVIKELLEAAQEIANLHKEGEKLGLTTEELAFYDALTKPEVIKDFYENNVLVEMTRELTEMLRKNRTIDWQKKETARAGMRKMVKRLLKKYKYPPEGMDDAVQTVITQCELWTDNMEVLK